MTDAVETTTATETDANASATTANQDASTAATKTGEGAAAQTAQTTDAKATAPVIPEAYAFTKADDSLLSDAHVEVISAVAKDLGLSQEQADKVYGIQESAVRLYEDTAIENFKARLEAGDKALRDDAAYGGAKYDDTIAAGSEALNKFESGKALAEKLKAVGYDKDPDLRRFLADVGRAMREDRGVIAPAVAPVGDRKSDAQTFYGSK